MLGCALEYYGVYWPLFVLIFYFICPIPHFIARRVSDDSDAASSACRELAYFFTTGIVVSAFGFPIILARVEAISSTKQDVSANRSDRACAVGKACAIEYLQDSINMELCWEEPEEYLWIRNENKEYFGNCWFQGDSELSLGDVSTNSLRGTVRVAQCDCTEGDTCECLVPSLRLNHTYIMWLKMLVGVTPLWSPLLSVKPIDIVEQVASAEQTSLSVFRKCDLIHESVM
ncbi:hypothetical protein BTVI_48883 [Pitangus sulphuratus]|nr:hypothetical protein BTVI_48883 [Pitangus sulphuratus]